MRVLSIYDPVTPAQELKAIAPALVLAVLVIGLVAIALILIFKTIAKNNSNK